MKNAGEKKEKKPTTYQPGQPFKLSRTKIDDFIKCPRCFYLDRVLGVPQPPGFPFTLNSAVDSLLKKEFDVYRGLGQPHPLMVKGGLGHLIPFRDPRMNDWRNTFKGVQYFDPKTKFTIYGAVDDLWINSVVEEVDPEAGMISVVDYKATSTSKVITLDEEYRQGFKRQAEIYQWLLRRLDLKISNTAYFFYVNGLKTTSPFTKELPGIVTEYEGIMHFSMQIIPYVGDDSWVRGAVDDIFKVLNSKTIPGAAEDCKYCEYRNRASQVLFDEAVTGRVPSETARTTLIAEAGKELVEETE